ncbi:MAG: TatD family hydrolase [Syntrophobacteria bacterium]
MFVDSHCHLYLENFLSERGGIVTRARQAGVDQMITVGTDLPGSHPAVALAETYPGLYATVGIHPHNACKLSAAATRELARLVRNPRLVGYGEVGRQTTANSRRIFRLPDQGELTVRDQDE